MGNNLVSLVGPRREISCRAIRLSQRGTTEQNPPVSLLLLISQLFLSYFMSLSSWSFRCNCNANSSSAPTRNQCNSTKDSEINDYTPSTSTPHLPRGCVLSVVIFLPLKARRVGLYVRLIPWQFAGDFIEINENQMKQPKPIMPDWSRMVLWRAGCLSLRSCFECTSVS